MTLKNAYDVKWWRFDKYYLKYYQSTVLNTSKHTTSSKKWSIITTFLIFMAMIAYFMYPALSLSDKLKNDPSKTNEQNVASVPQHTDTTQISTTASTTTVQSVDSIPIPQAPIKPIEPPKITGFAQFGDKCTAYLDNGAKADITNDECLAYATGKKHVELKQTIQDNYNNNYQYATQAEQIAYAPTQ